MLERLCALACRFDPVPEYLAAACCAIGAAASRSKLEIHMGEHPMSLQTPPADSDVPIQKPLTLVMPIKSQRHAQALRDELEKPQGLRTRIHRALDNIRTVHFARFVVLAGDPPQLAVITSYDDEFDDYIMSFTDWLGDEFDMLLEFVDGPPRRPVKHHREEFLAYVKANDLACVGEFYSAYPQKRVGDISPPRSPVG